MPFCPCSVLMIMIKISVVNSNDIMIILKYKGFFNLIVTGQPCAILSKPNCCMVAKLLTALGEPVRERGPGEYEGQLE
jgi:hypothetical protein